MIVQWYEGRYEKSTGVWLPDIGGSTPRIDSTSEIPVDPYGKPNESGEDSVILILKYWEELHSTMSSLATSPSRHSPYEFGNVMDCWERPRRLPLWTIQVLGVLP